MLELARKLDEHGHPSCLYLHGFRDLEPRHRALCAEAGIAVVGAPPPRWFGQLARIAPVAEAAATLRLTRMIRTLIRTHEIDVVVMPEDSPDYGGPAITAAAHAERVP